MSSLEARGKHLGMDWVCLVMDGGWRCGYVRIPPGHPLHGLSYDDPAPGAAWADLEKQEIGKRGAIPLVCADRDEAPRLDIVFDVHGSITFGGEFKKQFAEENGLQGWWIGFDCNHAGDAQDPALMSEDSPYRRHLTGDGVVRSKEYVALECHRLIGQIVERYGRPTQ